MIHAYPESYLSKAQSTLGDLFDYSINVFGISGENFIKLFKGSILCKRLELGDVALVAGKSGIELAMELIEETFGTSVIIEPEYRPERSAEYWIGWAVCYFQWYSSVTYSDIFNVYSFEDLKNLYITLHEADISKFVQITSERLCSTAETNLKRIRMINGYSQSQLAKKSGVGIRSIQMYEQRNKDINKAALETVYSLSRVLGCTVSALMEPSILQLCKS